MLIFFFQEETRSLGNLGAGSPIQKKEKVQMIIARSFYGAARSITDHSFTGAQRLQKRQVSKVLLDGLYDQGSPISKLFAVRTEVLGEIIWKDVTKKWQFFPGELD